MFFSVFSIKCCAWKSHKISTLKKKVKSACLANKYATLKVTKNTLFPILMDSMDITWCTISGWVYALRCWHLIGWLDNCINKQVWLVSGEWLVSVYSACNYLGWRIWFLGLAGLWMSVMLRRCQDPQTLSHICTEWKSDVDQRYLPSSL